MREKNSITTVIYIGSLVWWWHR